MYVVQAPRLHFDFLKINYLIGNSSLPTSSVHLDHPASYFRYSIVVKFLYFILWDGIH